MTDTGCSLCVELAGGPSQELIEASAGNTVGRVAWRDGDFVLLPSLGQLSRTHLLLLPTQHITSLAALPSEATRHVAQIMNAVRRLVQSDAKHLVAFEHGIGTRPDRQGGCGVSHAHLHLVAVDTRDPFMHPPAGGDFEWRSVNGIQAFENLDPNDDYLLYENPEGLAFVSCVRELPSQFMRKWMAEALALASWDWRRARDGVVVSERAAQLLDPLTALLDQPAVSV
jgi:diadenosine tetraphosphate (Ap4A) HIT family hydrolase